MQHATHGVQHATQNVPQPVQRHAPHTQCDHRAAQATCTAQRATWHPQRYISMHAKRNEERCTAANGLVAYRRVYCTSGPEQAGVPACSGARVLCWGTSELYHTYGTPVGLSAGTRGLTDSGGFSAERAHGRATASCTRASPRSARPPGLSRSRAYARGTPCGMSTHSTQRLPCCGYPMRTRVAQLPERCAVHPTAGTRASSATTRTPACRECCSRSSAGTSSRRRTGTIV